MTRLQMHAEFKLLLDKGDSFDAPSFLDSEIDAFLNISQEKFISKRTFGNNVRRTTFEEDQKRRDDLRNLISNQVLAPSTSTNNKPNGVFVTLPNDYRHTIQEDALLSNGRRVGVTPLTHDRYNKVINDPFNSPDSSTVYRLDFKIDQHELICGTGISVNKYYLRYISNPKPIGPNTDCLLSVHTHREIVKMAVVEALENVEQPRYQTSKIELNEIE
mgnify:CR=1 FL=1